MAKLITFSVSEEMKPIIDKFKEICLREGKSMSKMLVELIAVSYTHLTLPTILLV